MDPLHCVCACADASIVLPHALLHNRQSSCIGTGDGLNVEAFAGRKYYNYNENGGLDDLDGPAAAVREPSPRADPTLPDPRSGCSVLDA